MLQFQQEYETEARELIQTQRALTIIGTYISMWKTLRISLLCEVERVIREMELENGPPVRLMKVG